MTAFTASYALSSTLLNAPRGSIIPVAKRAGDGTITGLKEGLSDRGAEVLEMEYCYASMMSDTDLSDFLYGALIEDQVLIVTSMGCESRDVESRRLAVYLRDIFLAKGGRAFLVDNV